MVGIKILVLTMLICASVVTATVITSFFEPDNSDELVNEELPNDDFEPDNSTASNEVNETTNTTISNPVNSTALAEENETDSNSTVENPIATPLSYIGHFPINFTEQLTMQNHMEFVNGWFYLGIGSEYNHSFITNWTEWNYTFIKAQYANPYDNYTSDDFEPDFQNYTYAMYYWGYQSTLSYYVNLDSLLYDNGILRFSYNFTAPIGGDFSSISYPNSFVQIPKTELAGYGISEITYPS